MTERLRAFPGLAEVAEVLRQAHCAEEPAGFLSQVLHSLSTPLGASFAAVVTHAGGQWIPLAEAGNRQPLPMNLLADVLDQEAVNLQGEWVATPLTVKSEKAEALVFRMGPRRGWTQEDLNSLALLGQLVGEGLEAVRRYDQQSRRIRRLEMILAIAQQWNQMREVEPLLVQMAEAATRLLDADRASIFLWDRRTHTLVGRPALGVSEGELRVPDDRGVVGQVLKTGQPLRVDAASEPGQIDHRVDAQLGYRTRTLLCVPLRGKSGELFGAFELINKRTGAFTVEDEAGLVELAGHAAVALENAQDREQLISSSRQIADQAAEQVRLIGRSPAMDVLRGMVRRVAETDLAVLILGENGTGKEVVAQSIHYLSRRRDRPFIAVNCAAIPDTLAESELFGHEKGAFTDAREMRPGKFELAASGTLFLDEIGDLSLGGQAKLLRVLEEKVLVRVGGSLPIHTDARVLAATNQNLAEMVRNKKFREDLYYRLNVVTMEVPALRDRVDDILLLAEHFLEDFCKKARRKVLQLSAEARSRLQAHPWPGNVRELRNLMERLAYMSPTDRIEPEDLAFILSPRGTASSSGGVGGGADGTLADATAQFQVGCIQRAIERAGGNMSLAATLLGLHRSNLYRKMRQLDMPIPD